MGLTASALPELKPCRSHFGCIAEGRPFAGVPITAMLGDQQAASFGQLCLSLARPNAPMERALSW